MKDTHKNRLLQSPTRKPTNQKRKRNDKRRTKKDHVFQDRERAYRAYQDTCREIRSFGNPDSHHRDKAGAIDLAENEVMAGQIIMNEILSKETVEWIRTQKTTKKDFEDMYLVQPVWYCTNEREKNEYEI